jgi:hypothetical protein
MCPPTGIMVTRWPGENADTASMSGPTNVNSFPNGTYSPNGTRNIFR